MILVLLLILGTEATNEELLARADHAFAEGLQQREQGQRGARSFRSAAQALEDLRARGCDNPLVLRNLGNAYWLAGDLPRAILTYRQGLRQRPGDAGLRDLLASAREQVVFVEGSVLGRPVDELRSRWRSISLTWLFLGATLTYALACLALTRWWMLRQRGFLITGLVLLALALTVSIGILERQLAPTPRDLVVVARDGVFLRKGDGEAFPPWFPTPLNRGVEAEIVYRRDGWLQIGLPGGEMGWVASADVVE